MFNGESRGEYKQKLQKVLLRCLRYLFGCVTEIIFKHNFELKKNISFI